MITDFEKALAVLRQHRVEFIVIGGVAGTLHGSAFMTQDLDVVYSRTRGNIQIVLKRAAGRPKDSPVVAELQRILESRRNQSVKPPEK